MWAGRPARRHTGYPLRVGVAVPKRRGAVEAGARGAVVGLVLADGMSTYRELPLRPEGAGFEAVSP